MSLNFLSFKRMMQRLIVIIPGRFNSLKISVTLFLHQNENYVIFATKFYSRTCINRPPAIKRPDFSLIQTFYLLPVLGGHHVAVPCLSFFVIFTRIKRPPLNGN